MNHKGKVREMQWLSLERLQLPQVTLRVGFSNRACAEKLIWPCYKPAVFLTSASSVSLPCSFYSANSRPNCYCQYPYVTCYCRLMSWLRCDGDCWLRLACLPCVAELTGLLTATGNGDCLAALLTATSDLKACCAWLAAISAMTD